MQAVHGPGDLRWSQAAAILTQKLGRDVTVERISDEAMRSLRVELAPERDDRLRERIGLLDRHQGAGTRDHK